MTRKRQRQGRGRVDWTFFRVGGREIFCSRCGGSAPIALPVPISRLVRIIDGFNLMHADCPEDQVRHSEAQP